MKKTQQIPNCNLCSVVLKANCIPNCNLCSVIPNCIPNCNLCSVVLKASLSPSGVVIAAEPPGLQDELLALRPLLHKCAYSSAFQWPLLL